MRSALIAMSGRGVSEMAESRNVSHHGSLLRDTRVPRAATNPGWRLSLRLVVFTAAVFCANAPATAEGTKIPRPVSDAYPEHTLAVELGRAGKHREALRRLEKLIAEFPDEYPFRRDYILIASWGGQCDPVLEEFSRIGRRPSLEPYVIGPVRECAVRRARAGETAEALATLLMLERFARGDYPLARDIILITIWDGDCPGAVDRFGRLADPQRLEPYVAEPLANCLLQQHRTQEALTLTRTAMDRYPGDEALRHANLRAEIAWRLKSGTDDTASDLDIRVAHQQPDQGTNEWAAEVTAGAPLARKLRGYVRYLNTRSSDAAYREGEMSRLALGIRYSPTEQWRMSIEASDDLSQPDREGGSVSIGYLPSGTTHYWISATTYAEDSPLRGRAVGIDAESRQAGIAARTLDYRWDARAVVSRYVFSDSNRRDSVYATVGYAYELLAKREQRVYLEWHESDNSLAGTVYFNPSHDAGLGVVHRTSFVHPSRFRRHVDNLQVWLGEYRQDGYETRWRWGVRFEQDYDFDERHALGWGLAHLRNAYDGVYETELRLDARYRWRF